MTAGFNQRRRNHQKLGRRSKCPRHHQGIARFARHRLHISLHESGVGNTQSPDHLEKKTAPLAIRFHENEIRGGRCDGQNHPRQAGATADVAPSSLTTRQRQKLSPVDKMPLVEVIRGKHTSDEAVATVFQYAKKVGKTPIVVKDAPGFAVNRILGPYMNEAAFLMVEGAGVEKIDRVMEKFGMPMGPIALLDEVGLDVAAKVSKILYGAFGERMRSPALFETITAEKRFGKKVGKGIYLYENGGKKKTLDTAFLQKVGIKDGSARLPDEEIVKRLVYLMINEAARVWEEGLVRTVGDIDVGMIFGTGFAPFRGGLLKYADSVGADHIVSDLELFSRKYGPRFAPAQFLQQLAVSGKKFYGATD